MGGDATDETERLKRRVSELEAALSRRELRATAAQVALLSMTLPAREATIADAERAAHLGTWIWDTRTQRVSWSPELYRIFGYDPERVEPSVEAFHAALHPADLDRVRAVSAANVAAGTAGAPVSCRFVQPSGAVREAIMDGLPIRDGDDALLGFAGTVLDVTDRVARERTQLRTQALLNEAQRIAHVGSWVWDRETDAIEWSDELYRITGVSPGTPATGESWRECVHPEDRELALVDCGAVSTPYTVDLRLVRPDGLIRSVRVVSHSIANQDGQNVGYIGVVHDLTEQRALEGQLRQSQKMQAIGRVAAGVAHDFNNVLTVIRGNCEVLSTREPSEEVRQIFEASEQATRLTRLLLSFGQRHQPLDRREVALENEVAQSARLVQSLLGGDVVLEIRVEGPLWAVHGDPVQVHQIVSNLLLNARDAMPNGGKIILRLENRVIDKAQANLPAELGPGDYVFLEVEDNGVGMTEEVRLRAVEPFFTTKEPGKGTGLGLATVFGIVRQRAGALDIRSTVGEGTSVRIYLPRA